MGESREERVAAFVEDYAHSLVAGGVPRMPARVFACLLASPGGRATAAELAQRLTASPAAISGAVRYLVQVTLAKRLREPGSRRDVYLVEHEAFYQAMLSRDVLLDAWADSLNRGIEVLGPGTEDAALLEEMRDVVVFVRAELGGLVARWEEHRAARTSPAFDVVQAADPA